MQEKFCNFYISQVPFLISLVGRWNAVSFWDPEISGNREPRTKGEVSEATYRLFDPRWTLPQDVDGRL